MPPLALPKKEYMQRAQQLWGELGLPTLRPQEPWYGEASGDWLDIWDQNARVAVAGGYLDNGLVSLGQQRKNVKPETKFRPTIEKDS